MAKADVHQAFVVLGVLVDERPTRVTRDAEALEDIVDAFGPAAGSKEPLRGVAGGFQDPVAAAQDLESSLSFGDVGEDALPHAVPRATRQQIRVVVEADGPAVGRGGPILRL